MRESRFSPRKKISQSGLSDNSKISKNQPSPRRAVPQLENFRKTAKSRTTGASPVETPASDATVEPRQVGGLSNNAEKKT